GDPLVTGVETCALPICGPGRQSPDAADAGTPAECGSRSLVACRRHDPLCDEVSDEDQWRDLDDRCRRKRGASNRRGGGCELVPRDRKSVVKVKGEDQDE